MGTTLKQAERILGFEAEGMLPPGGLIAEMGAQELAPSTAAEEVAALFARHRPDTALPRDEAGRIAAERWTSALYQAFGFGYVSFDLVEAPANRPTDLNRESVPPELRGRAALVTNFGTTEHIIDQVNCFRFIHELAAPRAIIWHNLPISDFYGHGFFKYDPQFFLALGMANGYEVLSWQMTVGLPSQHFHRIPERLFDLGMPRIEPRASAIDVVFRKRDDRPFALPIDAPIPPAEQIARILERMPADTRILIYGAGSLGKALAGELAGRGVPVAGFLDTHREGTCAGLPVRRFDGHRPDPRDAIVIASSFAAEIRPTLAQAGCAAVFEVTAL